MSEITATIASPIQLPEARVPITVRRGTMADIPFVDSLMKKHSKQLAFLPTKALEGKVALGHVLIAEATVASEDALLATRNSQPATRPVGYLIGNDRYKSRDEIGVIYQLCVAPEYRRMLVAAHLLKARFETSAYGCKLYCCWCAQDLVESNRFYESMGFVPLAFRAGSEKRSRVHIFWQKRIRDGDTTTPWWFPSETRGGLMDAARIALPIPPSLSWWDELPRLLPTSDPQLPNGEDPEQRRKASNRKSRVGNRNPTGGFYFGKSPTVKAEEEPAKPKKLKRAQPELADKARELRDRWVEHVANNPLPTMGKYDVSRMIETTGSITPLLAA